MAQNKKNEWVRQCHKLNKNLKIKKIFHFKIIFQISGIDFLISI